jgi:hypothetical protein
MKTGILTKESTGHLLAAALLSTTVGVMSTAASAAPITLDHLAGGKVSSGAIENVYWRGRGWGWGGGWGGPLVAGAIVGGALAAAPYYGGGYYYGAPYGAPYGYGYGPPPGAAYSDAPPPDDGYCAQRYRSYDPASGTFLGNDGRRHPCP